MLCVSGKVNQCRYCNNEARPKHTRPLQAMRKLIDMLLLPFVILLLWLGDQWRWLQRIEDERWED